MFLKSIIKDGFKIIWALYRNHFGELGWWNITYSTLHYTTLTCSGLGYFSKLYQSVVFSLPTQELPIYSQSSNKTLCYFPRFTNNGSSLWPDLVQSSPVRVNLLFLFRTNDRVLSESHQSASCIKQTTTSWSPEIRDLISCRFSLERRQQSRPFLRGPGAREENPREHPTSRPQTSHRGPAQYMELHTGQSDSRLQTGTAQENIFSANWVKSEKCEYN